MTEPKPWLESKHTQIWNITEQARRIGTEHPQDDASIAVWLAHAPWMHPAWHWHYVGLVHLRDLPGQSRPVTRTLAGATHEFMVWAVDPHTQPDLADFKQLHFLSPVSIVQQFIGGVRCWRTK